MPAQALSRFAIGLCAQFRGALIKRTGHMTQYINCSLRPTNLMDLDD